MSSSTLLEIIRASHEQIEGLELLIGKHLQKNPSSYLERLYQRHQIRNLIDSITSTTLKLIELYDEKENMRNDEIAAYKGTTDVFNSFYDRLRDVYEFHRQNRNCAVDLPIVEEKEPIIRFSGEECNGLYLDLHEHHNQYLNINLETPTIDYSEYLDIFWQPDKLPHCIRKKKGYKNYLENLLEYMLDFCHRIDPLRDLSRIFATGTLHQQEQKGRQTVSILAIDDYNNVKELMEVGSQKLKEALAALGLKTGGTAKQQAERLFAIKSTPLEQLDHKYFPKSGMEEVILAMEIKIKRLGELLSENIRQTKEYIVKKQGLTYEELEAERISYQEQVPEADSDVEDEEEEVAYNPRKYPLDADNKPIAHWLYNLHGLGQAFHCEICGSRTYWGRRAFERHFNQPQHQQGMRLLGIPNSKSFYEITTINEAKAIWEKIKERRLVKRWRSDLEEFEDGDGNVYDGKMYNDLKRQRLI